MEHPAAQAADAPLPALHESLLLELPSADWYQLTRTLSLPGGLQAQLVCEGAEPGALLDAVQAVPPASQLRWAGGVLLALSYRVSATSGDRVLTQATAQVAGLKLRLEVSRVAVSPPS